MAGPCLAAFPPGGLVANEVLCVANSKQSLSLLPKGGSFGMIEKRPFQNRFLAQPSAQMARACMRSENAGLTPRLVQTQHTCAPKCASGFASRIPSSLHEEKQHVYLSRPVVEETSPKWHHSLPSSCQASHTADSGNAARASFT